MNDAAFAAQLSQSVEEFRRKVQEAADQLGISREDALQQIFESLIVNEKRTPSERVTVLTGFDKTFGRTLINFAHCWNQQSMDQLRLQFGEPGGLDETSFRIAIFCQCVPGLDPQRAGQILNIARDEAARVYYEGSAITSARVQTSETMSDRTSSEALSVCLSRPIAEVRQMVQEAATQWGISKEDAIQHMIESITLNEQRTPSEKVSVVTGGDKTYGRNLLNFAHFWNQQSMNQLQLLFGETGLDETSLRVGVLTRSNLGINAQQAEQILRIARDEASRTGAPV
jgi:hypothetical protein